MKNQKIPRNIFYFSTGGLGDFLMILFFMDNVYKNFSGEKDKINLYILVQKNKENFLDLAQKYEYVKILELNKKNLKTLSYLLKFIFSRNYAITHTTFGAISFPIKITAKLLTLRSDSNLIGFDDNSNINKYIYNKLLTFNPQTLFLETMKELLSETGFQVKSQTPEFKYIEEPSLMEKHQLVAQKYIVLHPFARVFQRSLPEEKFIFLLKRIITFKDLKLVIIGSLKDKEKVEEILLKTGYRKKEEILNLCGDLTFQELGNLIDKAKLFIGVDSGLTHLAGMLQKESLIIGNYSNPCWLPYYNKKAVILYNTTHCPNAPCNKKKHLEECKVNYLRCLIDISEETIAKSLDEIINR